jgi:tripartite ATP-independent transporter DctM subunit
MEAVFAIWLILLLLGMPVFSSLGIASALHIFTNGQNVMIIPQKTTMAINSFPLLAAPFFIMMGNLMNSSGVTNRIFNFANVAVGWMRGGLGHANIVASVIFAGMSGAAVADAGGLGTIEIAAMRKAGYDDDFTVGITAASATIGPIIPPSIPMIIYVVMSEASIGGMFLGGVFPGLLMAIFLMLMVRHYAIKRNYPHEPIPAPKQVWRSFYSAFWALLAPGILLFGIFSGVFTPTEAAVFATAYALFLGLFVYHELRFRDIPKAVLITTQTNGVIQALVVTAVLFGWQMATAQVPQLIGNYLLSISGSKYVLLFIINVFLLFVGCFMEAAAAMMILVPILAPVAETSLGMSSIQFGVMVVLNLMIGTITPPIGVVLFVTANVANITFERMSRAIVPFLFPLILVLALVTIYPPLTIWLPKVLMGVR